MTDTSSRNTDKNKNEEKHAFGWLLPLFAFFPFIALVTYDWHAIADLNLPPAPSANWIGALGDGFAYWGYKLVGLAVWLVPVLCIIGGLLVMMLYNMYASLLRSVGDSRTPLIFLIISSAINVGLDLLFMRVLGLGVHVGVTRSKPRSACDRASARGRARLTETFHRRVQHHGRDRPHY